MEKTPRYTAMEKRLLLKLIANQKDIIEKKKTDAYTNRSKENAWRIITKSYNNFVKFKRTTKQLRQLYKNMKYAANVNSTSTSNLTEMLDILEMQILNDPNIKSGENVMIPKQHPQHSMAYPNVPAQLLQQNLHHQNQHHQQQQQQPPQPSKDATNFLMENLIKTELLDEDDIDDEMISQTLSQVNEAETSSYPREDFTPFPTQASTSPNLFSTPKETPVNQNNNVNSTFKDDEIYDDIDDEDIDDDDDDLNEQNSHFATSMLDSSTKTKTDKFCANTKETLISIAIEERRKKIELLETQINYWKTLTNKIETCQKICCCKVDSFHNRNHFID